MKKNRLLICFAVFAIACVISLGGNNTRSKAKTQYYRANVHTKSLCSLYRDENAYIYNIKVKKNKINIYGTLEWTNNTDNYVNDNQKKIKLTKYKKHSFCITSKKTRYFDFNSLGYTKISKKKFAGYCKGLKKGNASGIGLDFTVKNGVITKICFAP